MKSNLLRFTLIVIGVISYQLSFSQSCDTLRNYNLDDTFYEFTGVAGHPLGHEILNAGTNPVTDWAEPYTATAATEVRRLQFVPWVVHDEGGSVTFNVYDDNAGEPGAVLGSETVPLADFTENTFTEVDFTTPVNVNGNFFVGFELTYNTPQDTFAITGTHKPGGVNYTQMYFDGAWSNVDDIYTMAGDPFISAWELDVLTSTAPSPVAEFNFNTTACLGGEFNVDGSPSQNVDQYLWYLTGAGATPIHDNDEGLNGVLTPTVSGLDQEIYLIADGGCQTDVVGYLADVFDPITADVNTTNSTCGNNNGEITVSNEAGGSGNYSYSLDGTNFQTNQTFSGLAPATYTVYVVSGGDGCETTYSVTVNATPPETITVGSDQTVCLGDGATITASGTGTIEWFDGATSEGTGTSITVSPGATTTYDAVLTDANGCEDTDQVTVNVNPLPTIDAGNDEDLCTGNSTTVSATGGSTYNWDNGLGAGASHTVNPTSNTTYTVTGTDANGCENTDNITITVNPLPTIDAGTDATSCAGENVTISATGGSTYSWDNGLGAGASHTINPTSNTTYTVTGTDVNGCENTDNVTITVNALPTIDAGTDATSCAGENVTISATGGSTYSWDNGLGAGASHTINPTNTTTYTVTGTDANGCENTDDVEITVNPLPTVTTSADDDICVGENTTISASGADSYTWNNGLGAGTSHTVNPTNTTTYEATGTDVNGCENTDQVTITVNQIDDPSFTFNDYCDAATSNGPSNIATPGGTFGFNPTPTDGATIDATSGEISGGVVGTTYSVEYITNGNCPDSSIETVTVQTNDDPSFDYNDICLGNNLPIEPYNIGTSGGTFSFVTTPTDGATIDGSAGEISNATQGSSYDVEYLTPSGVCQASSTETIQVYNAPTVTASNDETVCDGETVTITASGADSYTWDNGLGSGSSQNVTPSNTTTYIVTGEENTNGCTNTDEVVVTVNPLPAVDAGTDEAICDGDDVTLSASGADNYSWDNGLGAGASHTTNPSSTTTYEVIGTDLNGCENSAVVTITVNPLPTVDAGNDQFLCEGDDVTLTASGANNYTWDNGITQGTPFTPSVGSTTYTVTGTDANGCENTDQVEVSVEEYPSVNAGDNQTLCANHDPITLSGNPSGGTYSGNGITGSDFDPNEAGVGSHDITYTYETANGCESTDVITLTVDGCASIDENNILNELSIMPNPATDYLDIVFDNSITINNIELMSAEGRFVQIDVMTLSDNKTKVNVSNAEKGTYFIRLNTSNGNIVKKVIIH